MIGKNEEQLFSFLKKIDSITTFDPVYISSKKVEYDLTVNSTASGISGWSMTERWTGKKIRGRGLDSLKKRINSVQTSELDNKLSVLCLSDLKKEGKQLETVWIKTEPGCPFVLKDNKPEFETVSLTLPEDCYQHIKETGIAVYNEVADVLYPLLKIACKSIAKLMDAASAFKYMDVVPLGTALVFSKYLENAKDIRFIHRMCCEKQEGLSVVKPLIGIAGSRYVRYSQYDFFKEAYDICCKYHLCHVGEWTFADDTTRVNIILDDMPDANKYRHCILLETGDVPGSSLSVTALVQFGDSPVFLEKRNNYHSKSFKKRGGVEALFVGIFEAFDKFEEMYQTIEDTSPVFCDEWLQPIAKVIGKKRMKPFYERFDPAGFSTGTSLFEYIVKNTYHKMPEKPANELSQAYKALFDHMCSREEISYDNREEYMECV